MTRRMFSDEITTSDAFLDMPTESQLLYFHLGMNADDDGFIANPKMIQRIIGASQDSLMLLFAKKFLISFDNGVCVVKHWRINNYIRKDIYNETKYLDQKKQLFIRPNGSYSMRPDGAIPLPNGHFTIGDKFGKEVENVPTEVPLLPTSTERARDVHLGKVREGKERKGKERVNIHTKFTKPTVEEIKAYCDERKNGVDPQGFFDHYEARGWIPKGYTQQMKDWKAAVRTWEKFNKKFGNDDKGQVTKTHRI